MVARKPEHKKGGGFILEKDIEKKLVEYIKSKNGMCVKLNSTSTVGLPDRLVILKDKIIFVELKAPSKKPRAIQDVMIKRLKALGCDVRVIDSIDEIKNIG